MARQLQIYVDKTSMTISNSNGQYGLNLYLKTVDVTNCSYNCFFSPVYIDMIADTNHSSTPNWCSKPTWVHHR